MNKKLAQVERIAKDLEEVSPDNLERFVDGSLRLFQEVLQKLQSEDPKQKQEALEMADSLRKTLEEQTTKAMEAVEMTTKELEAFTSNPENFTEEEWQALQTAKKHLSEFQKEVKQPHSSPSKKKSKKEKKNLWIAG